MNRLFLLLFISIVWLGCDNSTNTETCTPNETNLCNCLEEGEVLDGIQECKSDGSGYESCQCGGEGSPVEPAEEEGGDEASESGDEEPAEEGGEAIEEEGGEAIEEEGGEEPAEEGGEATEEEGGEEPTEEGGEEPTEEGGEEPTEEGGEEPTEEGGEEPTEEGGEEPTEEGGEEPTEEGGEEPTEEGGEEPTEEGGEEPTEEGGEEPSEEGGEEPTEEGGEEPTEEGGEGGDISISNDCPNDCLELISEVDRYLCALDICYEGAVTYADFSSPTGDDITLAKAVVNHFGDLDNDLSPKEGSTYGLLGTGECFASNHSQDLPGGTSAPDPFSSDGYSTFDNVEFIVEMVAPEGAVAFAIDYVFFSMEYEEYVGSTFNDKFYIQLEAPETTGGELQVVNNTACSDPDAYFDFTNEDGSKGCFMGINTVFSESCADPATNILGTGFECKQTPTQVNDGSSTGWLTTSWPIQGGEAFKLVFHIHDTSDGIYDSQVILDNFRFLSATDGFVGGGTTK